MTDFSFVFIFPEIRRFQRELHYSKDIHQKKAKRMAIHFEKFISNPNSMKSTSNTAEIQQRNRFNVISVYFCCWNTKWRFGWMSYGDIYMAAWQRRTNHIDTRLASGWSYVVPPYFLSFTKSVVAWRRVFKIIVELFLKKTSEFSWKW